MSRIDFATEFKVMGLVPLTSRSNAAGWIRCRAAGRKDKHPSGSFSSKTGAYKDFASGEKAIGFFDACVRLGRFQTWQEAVEHFADRLGIKVPSKEKPRPHLLPLKPSGQRARMFARRKPGIVPESLALVEAQQAEWPGRAPANKRYTVFALPIYGPNMVRQGHVVINAAAADMELWQGHDAPPIRAKSYTVQGSKPGLLNGPALRAMPEAELVWKVEGVTDLLALAGAIPPDLRGKHLVTTNPNGASQEPTAEMLHFLAGRRVYVIHDRDRAGVVGAEKWCAALAHHCPEVRNVELPYPVEEKHGKDLRDFIAEGHAYADMLALADAAAPIIPAGPPPLPSASGEHEAEDLAERLKLIELEVMGHYENGDVEVFSMDRRQAFTVKNLNFLSYAQLLQVCGAAARSNVTESESSGENGAVRLLTVKQVRNAIGYCSGYRRISAKRQIGAGAWRLNGDPSIVIVDAGRAAVWKDDKLEPISIPRVGDFVLDFRSDDHSWCDFAALGEHLAAAADTRFCVATFQEVFDVVRQWHFAAAYDAITVTALVFCTWVQTLWDYRPHVAVIGQTNAGKSILLENLLQGLFGRLCLYTNKPSEAAVRQHVSHRAMAILLDEFEDDHHRQRVLELLRTSTRGTQIIRGTADQRGRSFGMKHIAWIGAIEPGLKSGPDRNRFIVFEIGKPAKRRPPNIPASLQLAALGLRCLAVAVRNIDRAREIYKRIATVTLPDVDGRVIENYSVPASMHAVIHGHDEDAAAETLKKMVGEKYANTPAISDERDLLRDILGSLVVVGPAKTMLVSDIIKDPESYRNYGTELERQGVSLTKEGRGRRDLDASIQNCGLFLVMRHVARNLLRGTRWGGNGMDLDALVKRAGEGTRAERRTIGSRREHGITIPSKVVQEYMDQSEWISSGEAAELDTEAFTG